LSGTALALSQRREGLFSPKSRSRRGDCYPVRAPGALEKSAPSASAKRGGVVLSAAMAHTTTPRSRFLGLGHYLPPVIRTNVDLEKMVDTSDAWITERTGIRARHIAPDGVVTSDMATHAANQALEMAGLKATDLDMIIVGTVTPDMPMPATAVFVQQKLGAGTCPAFDLSAACAGFVFGLTIADQFVRSGAMKHVLVVGVELLSRVIDWSDRTTCVLFGDGAGAVVVGPADPNESDRPSGILSTAIHTDGALATSLLIPGGGSVTPASHEMIEQKLHKVHMKGQDIFKVAVRNLFSASKNALDAAGMTEADVDWICAHQANLRIIDQVTSRLHVPQEKVLINIDRVGNTSSASIPILVDENFRAGKIKKGDTVLMCALGAGISWGSALVRM
jgi:3-oxoacyl-[acyl-carrier-protein] synthase-3